MDTGDGANHNGNGNGHKPHVPESGSPSSDLAAPQGAPVEPLKVDASSGTPPPSLPPEPLIVVDADDLDPEIEPAPIGLARKQLAFLAGLEEGLTKAGARKVAGISKTLTFKWRHAVGPDGNLTPNAVEFLRQEAISYEIGTQTLVDEARRRAFEGWDEPKFDKNGDEVGVVRKYDSTLLMFLIKQRDPSFREKYEVTGANGSPLHPSKVAIDVNMTYTEALKTLSDEELAQHNAIAQKLLARSGGSVAPGAN